MGFDNKSLAGTQLPDGRLVCLNGFGWRLSFASAGLCRTVMFAE
ncbi:hypothetical protein [Faecalibacterium sp. An58]|nr:hypothetical protein [Faecalibacterium sp. An58]